MVAEKFDAIVVGAGPCGTTAALTMARAGLNVILLERGEYPGAKNMFGGVIYRWPLEKIIPKFWEKAPIERYITDYRIMLLSKTSGLTLNFRDLGWAEPPYNSYAVLRANFDKWYATQAEEAGAVVISSVTVTDLIWNDGKVVGVRAGEGADNEVFGDAVIAADGINADLAMKAGLRKPMRPGDVTIGIKEVFEVPSDEIEKRFMLGKLQGTSIVLMGVTRGMMGGGFIYTFRNSIGVGLVILLEHLMRLKVEPYKLLDEMESHPLIKELIGVGKAKEYGAHMIPEAGYYAVPKLYTDGLLVAGDAANLCDVLYFEGTNLAMASGMLAGEAVIRAKKNRDFSKRSLAVYERLLRSSYVMKELYRRRNVPKFMGSNPRLFGTYVDLINDSVKALMTFDGETKEEKRRRIMQWLRERVGYANLLKDAIGARNFLP